MKERRLGPYILERELGAGAMGAVYQGRHVELDATYAIKIMHADLCDPRDAARFQRELESMAAVSSHPNVVKIHAGGQEHGRLYCVMDLVDGEDLQKRVARGPVPVREAVMIVRDIARAVAALHGHGIIHRDIKPENILVGLDGVPRLTDFGLARLFATNQNRLTLTGELVGTPAYMAPEQALGSTALGPGTDVYALGALLYVLIAGRPPVAGDSKLMVLSLVATGELTPLGVSAPDAPEAVAKLCERAMAFEIDDRISATEFAHALDGFLLVGRPGRAAGVSVRERTMARWLASLCALGLALGGLMVGIAAYRSSAGESASLVQRMEDRLAKGDTLLDSEAAPAPGELQALLDLERDLAAAEFETRAALVSAVAAEYALRMGDVGQAQTRLKALESLPKAEAEDESLGARLRLRKVALEAALSVAAGDPEGAMSLRGRLERAGRSLPARRHLRTLAAQLALLAGNVKAAKKDVALLGDAAPTGLRFALAILAEDWETAESLETKVEEPLLRARLHLHLGDGLREKVSRGDPRRADLVAMRGHFEQAGEVPADDPLRGSIVSSLRKRCEVLRRAGSKSRGRTATGAEASAMLGWMTELVGLRLALRELDSSAVQTQSELETIEEGCMPLVVPRKDLELLSWLVELDPERKTYRQAYTTFAMRRPQYDPEVVLPVFREIVRRANAYGELAERVLILDHYARVLLAARRVDELQRLLNDVEAEFQETQPSLVIGVRGRYGKLLWRLERYEEALGQLDLCLVDNASSNPSRALRFRVLDILFTRDGDREHLELALEDGWILLRGPHKPGEAYAGKLAFVSDRVSTHELAEGHLERALEALEVFLEGSWSGFPGLESKRIRLLLRQGDSADRDRAIDESLERLASRVAYYLGLSPATALRLKHAQVRIPALRRLAEDRDWLGFSQMLDAFDRDLP